MWIRRKLKEPEECSSRWIARILEKLLKKSSLIPSPPAHHWLEITEKEGDQEDQKERENEGERKRREEKEEKGESEDERVIQYGMESGIKSHQFMWFAIEVTQQIHMLQKMLETGC